MLTVQVDPLPAVTVPRLVPVLVCHIVCPITGVPKVTVSVVPEQEAVM